jgi:hypothetical protein
MVLIGAFLLDNSLSFLQSLADKRQKGIIWLFAFVCVGFTLPSLSRHLAYDMLILSNLSGQMSCWMWLRRPTTLPNTPIRKSQSLSGAIMQ